MFTLHIEAPTVNELVERALKALHITFPVPPAQPADVANIADAAKKRGRPAKTAETPAGASVPAVPASQAQVENSASAPAGSSPAEGAPPAGPPLGAPAAGLRTVEDARAALHSVTVRVEGDANDSAGLKRASEILTVLGYRKISDVKVEDYGKLIEMCAAKMKDLKPVVIEKTT